MKKFLKKISILLPYSTVMLFAVLPGTIIASKGQAPKPKSKPTSQTSQPQTSVNKPSLMISAQQKYSALRDKISNKPNQPAEKSPQQSSELSTSQKLAIQTRNVLSKTGINDKGWIDSIAGTKDYAKSDGTIKSKTQYEPVNNPMQDMNSVSVNIENTKEWATDQATSGKSLEAPIQRPVSQSMPTAQKSNKSTPGQRESSVGKSKGTTINTTNNPLYFEAEFTQPAQTKNKTSSSATNPSLDMNAARTNQSGIQTTAPKETFMSRNYKLMVKKLSDAMNNAFKRTNSQEKSAGEKTTTDPVTEVNNPLVSDAQTFRTHEGSLVHANISKNQGELFEL